VPIRITDITVGQKELGIPFQDDTIFITYNVKRITLETASTLGSYTGGQTIPMPVLARLLADVLLSWDLIDDANAPYPLTAESIQQLPVAIVEAIAVGLFEDMTPPKAGPTTSRSGSTTRKLRAIDTRTA